MAGDDFENHWRLLAWAVDTLLNLTPGEYPPISYEQTYSAVYKCVCQGYAEDLYRKLLEEMERQLNLVSDRLRALPDGQLIETFNNAWLHFSGGLSGIVPIFNYMARFYVESKLNSNLRLELMKIFDAVVVQPIIERLFDQLRSAQSTPFSVQPATMESVVRALYKLRPDSVNEIPDLYRRFIPELVQPVYVEELPDLQEEARQMITKARSVFSASRNGTEESASRDGPLVVSTSNVQREVSFDFQSMDFQMAEDDAVASSASAGEPVSDPVIGPVVRAKRRRSNVDSDDESGSGYNLHAYPDEPLQSPRSVDSYRSLRRSARGSDSSRPKKHFHCDHAVE